MTYRVRMTVAAELSLLEAAQWWAEHRDPSQAIEWLNGFERAIASLAIHPEKNAVDNIGKSIRFLMKNDEGESEWIETTVASRVRIKSAVHKDGDTQGRYKVRLNLQWKDFKKEVLVTLTDRTDMEYPLLIGRNSLRGDFLVDVEVDSDD